MDETDELSRLAEEVWSGEDNRELNWDFWPDEWAWVCRLPVPVEGNAYTVTELQIRFDKTGNTELWAAGKGRILPIKVYGPADFDRCSAWVDEWVVTQEVALWSDRFPKGNNKS